MPIIMQIEHKCLPCEMKKVDAKGNFTGYGAVFGNIDFGGDVVEKGAFAQTLEKHNDQKTMPAMLWSHDSRMPIGEWKSMSEDEHGLVTDGMLWVTGNEKGLTSVPEAERARNLALSNGPKGLSIGFIVKEMEFADIEGERVRIIKEVELLEVSPVVFAMNPKAAITNIKSLDFSNIREIENALTECGFSKKQSKALLAEGFKGLHCDDADPKRDAELQELINSIHSENSLLKGTSR